MFEELTLRFKATNKDLIVFEYYYKYSGKRYYNAPLAERDCKVVSEGRMGNLITQPSKAKRVN